MFLLQYCGGIKLFSVNSKKIYGIVLDICSIDCLNFCNVYGTYCWHQTWYSCAANLCAHTEFLRVQLIQFNSTSRVLAPCLVSWNYFGSCVGMCACVSVCVPFRALITSVVIYTVCDRLTNFKTSVSACGQHVPGFLKLFCPQRSVCVCPPLRSLITSSVWCDVDRVWLVKQVLRFFLLLNCFILLAINKMDGCGLVTRHIVNACQED